MGIRNVFVMMAVVLALVAGLACGGDDNRAEKAETLDITGTAQARAAAAAAPAAAPAATPAATPAAASGDPALGASPGGHTGATAR